MVQSGLLGFFRRGGKSCWNHVSCSWVDHHFTLLSWAWFILTAWCFFLSWARFISATWFLSWAWATTSTWFLSWAWASRSAWLLYGLFSRARTISATRSLLFTSNHHLVITSILQILDGFIEVNLLLVPITLVSDHPIDTGHLIIISLNLASNFVDGCLLLRIGGSSLENICNDSSVLGSGVTACDINLHSWVGLIVAVGSQS